MFRLIIWCKPFAKYFLIAWAFAILSVSSVPSIPTLKVHTAKAEVRLDYPIHFCEYGILAFLAFLSFAGKEFKINYRKFMLIIAGLILYAFLDEFHQKLVPGRTFNPKDFLSNIIGIIATLGFCILIFRKISHRLINQN